MTNLLLTPEEAAKLLPPLSIKDVKVRMTR